MQIKKLTFINFRNLKDNFIFPDNYVNVIYGNNAQGKTNLLEAIWLFTGGHSFRGNKDLELVRIENNKPMKKCVIKADFFSELRNQNARIAIENGKKTSEINGVKKNSGSALVGKICAVVFSPEHLRLIKDGPSLRRNFLDGAICQIYPNFLKTLASYKKVIINRNAMLKQMQNKNEKELETLYPLLEVWNEQAVTLGLNIMRNRCKYTVNLDFKARNIYGNITKNKERLEICYNPLGTNFNEFFLDPENIYRETLKKNLRTEIKQGQTVVGPHRDDFDVYINGMNAKTYASQGQQRSVVIAMKLSEAEIAEENIDESPIILLDDVMSELDIERQHYMLNEISNKQIFITSCNKETIDLMQKGKVFEVINGEIFERKN